MTQKNFWQTIAVCVAICGCDAAGPTLDMSMPPIRPAESCPALLEAYCAKARACSPFAWQLAWPDAAACAARLNLTCPQLAQVMGSRVTGADLAACAAKFSSQSCADFLGQSSPMQTCGFPSGTFPDGSGCGEDVQCQSLYCKKDASTGCGKCTTLSKSGGGCSTGLDCEKGLTCVGAAGARQCVAYLQMGASCQTTSGSVPCLPTLACRNGSCALPASLGESCSATAQDCDRLSGLSCPLSGKCVASATAFLGDTCGQQGSTFILCAGGSFCDMATKKCVAPIPDGAGCVASGIPSCQAPARCSSDVCKLPDPSLCK